MLEPTLVAAVQSNRVGEAALAAGAEEHHGVLDACAAIAARLDLIGDEIAETLRQAGVDAVIEPIERFPQRYSLELTVVDLATADAVGQALAPIGFEPWERWANGARRSFERHGDHLSFARTDDVTTVARVRWRPARARSGWRKLALPTPADWHAADLPTWAWWGYPVVRAVRLVAERIDPQRRHAGSLGPFLTTSTSLLDPLLDLADVGAGSRVVDLGCGDGRLVVAAAERGADAVGIETDAELVRRARARAESADVVARTSFLESDARQADLGDVDVVFAFLPVGVIADLLPVLLERMRAGAVLLIHEQNRLPDWVTPRPQSSDLVIGADAITVAHRWISGTESA